MMIVPEAANMPLTPWQTEILAPDLGRGDPAHLAHALSCKPYMLECMYESPPPLVLKGNLPAGDEGTTRRSRDL